MKSMRELGSFENRLLLITLAAGLVPILLITSSVQLVHLDDNSVLYAASISFIWLFYFAFYLKKIVVNKVRTLTSVVEALTCEDYSMRAKESSSCGVINELSQLINTLANTFAQQSLITKEKHILLNKVINQIDVAIIATDSRDNVTLMNPAAEKLFNRRVERMKGWPIRELGIPATTPEHNKQVLEFDLKEHKKKIYLHRDEYFENGIKQQLIFITDIQNLLREEERLAWQRLLRVLSHEINNSLAPIASISATLTRFTEANCANLPSELNSDLQNGLGVIQERANSLNEFIQSYQQLAKVPPPEKTLFNLEKLVQSITPLFDNIQLRTANGPIDIYADEVQLKQVLVNLIKNARESMASLPDGKVIICLHRHSSAIEIQVIDSGCGISNMDNIFVPFYTTKEKGTGIGLVLSRQLVVNNGGDLDIRNNDNGIGAQANIYFPTNQS
ncbi:PAS domain-containing protein [Shewanella sp. Scap07]|uniref:sensor histidine kinase n=1 Tax=Shewanella sp. Scap07 TaxID=2589987 RepID=UPI0015B80886|nr:ATP-binding protein [Shewanella sp. Scap07]QLE85802.1 PAS domain-containing protein [Shewanella sp. Scap07]